MHNKKAMASMVDAVIFTVIIGLLVVNFIIPHQLPDEQATHTGLIHDDLLRLRFSAATIFPELGNITLSISEMVAIGISKEDNSSLSILLMSIMHAMLGAGRPWLLIFIYGDLSMNFGLEQLDQSLGVIMSERSVAVGAHDTVLSRLYVL